MGLKWGQFLISNTLVETMSLYFYDVVVGDIYANGSILPPISQHPIQFQATAEEAQGKFFELGYNLDSEHGLFQDNKERFVVESFDTTSEMNEEDAVPNRLGVLFQQNPYTGVYSQIPLESIQFGKLLVFRTMQQMGGSRKRQSRKRSRKQKRTLRKRL